MGYRDALERAKAKLPKPTMQEIVIDDEIYFIDIFRLPGMEWSGITADAPPKAETDRALGFDTAKAALLACARHSTLYDAEKQPVPVERDAAGQAIPVDWKSIFDTISESERDAVIATWWILNSRDPNQRVSIIKKARQGGSATN